MVHLPTATCFEHVCLEAFLLVSPSEESPFRNRRGEIFLAPPPVVLDDDEPQDEPMWSTQEVTGGVPA